MSAEGQKPAYNSRHPLRSGFIDWAWSTQYHGVLDLAKSSHHIGRGLWGLILVFSLTLIILQMRFFLHDFIHGEDYTTVVFYEVPTAGFTYPNLTICPYGLTNKTRTRENEIDDNAFNYMYYAYQSLQYYSVRRKIALGKINMEPYRVSFENFVVNNPEKDWQNMTVALDSYLDECEGTFKQCEFNEREFECCQFVRQTIAADKVCLSLNPSVGVLNGDNESDTDIDYKQVKIGPENAIRTILNTGIKDQGSTGFDSGFSLHLNYAPNDEFSIPDPISLSPGSHTWVDIRMITHRLAKPTGVFAGMYPRTTPCEQKITLKYTKGHYSEQACNSDCDHEFFLYWCNCTKVASGLKTEYRGQICDLTKALDCAVNVYFVSKFHWTTRRRNDCYLNCKPACERSYVSASVSYNMFNKNRLPMIHDYLQNETKDEMTQEMTDNLVILSVYYGSSLIKVLELKERVTIDGLISNIGGVMGLWAGMSVVTLIQFIVYAIYALYRFYKEKQRQMDGILHELDYPGVLSRSSNPRPPTTSSSAGAQAMAGKSYRSPYFQNNQHRNQVHAMENGLSSSTAQYYNNNNDNRMAENNDNINTGYSISPRDSWVEQKPEF